MVLCGDDAVKDHNPACRSNCEVVSESVLRLNLKKKTLGNPGVFFFILRRMNDG